MSTAAVFIFVGVVTAIIAVIHTRLTMRRALGHTDIRDAIGQEFLQQMAIDMGIVEDTQTVYRLRRK